MISSRILFKSSITLNSRRFLSYRSIVCKESIPAKTSTGTSANIQDAKIEFLDHDPQYELPGFREKGTLPTNYEIATGPERFEYLHRLKGEDPWQDLKPIILTKKATKDSPIVLRGVDPVRYIGCTGYPAGSHELLWLTLTSGGPKHFDRCPDCGQVFKYIQESDHGEHHH